MSGRNSYIEKICIYSEFIDNILINNERFEGIKENYYFIYDKIYLDFLTEIVTDKLSKHNIYPKEIIEQFKEIIKRYKGYLMIDNERWDLIDEYNKIYETLDNIDEFNNDYLLINYRLKYDELGKIHKLSGVNFEEMTQSMLYDYPVLCNLLDGVLDEEIDYKYYLASFKKFKAIYPALFTIPSFLCKSLGEKF